MTVTTISLGGVSSAVFPEVIIEEVVRQVTPTIRDTYRTVPGRPGSWLFEEAAGDRELSVRFVVVGDGLAERREAVRRVTAWAYGDGLGRRKLVVSDEPDRFHWAKLGDVITSDELMTRGRFVASFRVSPFAESTTVSAATISGSGTVTVPAATGLAARLSPSIEVTATSALGAGFSLSANGRTLVYGSSMASGAKVTVSSISDTVTSGADIDADLDGLFVGANLAMTAVDGDFPFLLPGANAVTLAGGAATLAFRWRARYV